MSKYNWQRAAGVLMPISSLPSPYGIGTLGKKAYEFADWLKKAGQTYWQVLPVGPTGLGDSPYQSFSAFAGNPYFIDLDILIEEGLLTKADVDGVTWGISDDKTDYGLVYSGRFDVLKKAYSKSHHRSNVRYHEFISRQKFWIEEYALYMALKAHFDNSSWLEWDEDIRFREKDALNRYRNELREETDFWKFCQFKFYEQWEKFKTYVNNLGIKIIGDIPLYMSLDSADVWAYNDLFQMDDERRPLCVAGVPPDCFSADGQLWGNPIYDWDVMEKENFNWWRKRIESCAALYDIIRIDHFIGIVRYYSIPAGMKDAKIGDWREGPGEKLTGLIEEASGGAGIIAEDLGVIVPEVRALIDKMEWPGMKILEFAFEENPANEYLPHNFKNSNCVLYGGTHDNDTIRGYVDKVPSWQLRHIYDYLGVDNIHAVHKAMIKCGYASIAATAIYQMQDILGLGGDARMNEPSTVGHNWKWRLKAEELKDSDAVWLMRQTQIYGRLTY